MWNNKNGNDMDKQLNFLTKELVEKVAKKIDKEGIPQNREGKVYTVIVNGEKYPLKLLISEAAKVADIKLESKDFASSESNRKGFEEHTGFSVVTITDNLKKTFKEIITELKKIDGIIKKFIFLNTTQQYVWIKDDKDIIGTKYAHYEIIKRESQLYVELHFESRKRKEKDLFFENIKSLPERLEWFNWSPKKGNYVCKSIRVKESITMDDTEIIDKLKDKLLFLEKTMGDRIRSILQNEIPELNNSEKIKDIGLPLNQILFGPPGTGKTYHTINKAIEIIGEDQFGNKVTADDIQNMDRDKLKSIFDHFVEKGQIIFTTFHQSMGYEDFVEGIKPLTENGKVTYDVVPGIFINICQNASKKYESNFGNAYNAFIKKISEQEDNFELRTKTGKPFWVSVNTNNNLTLYTRLKDNQRGTLTKENLELYIQDPDIFLGWESYANGVIEHLKEYYSLSIQKEDSSRKNFVLIIDEINRGNVSSIFGELITLIEDDKRIGKPEEIRVVLPYSKDEVNKFGVPSNLYIIGTMNTADRSVEALDTALRRRFTFVYLPPEPEIIKKYGKLNSTNGVLKIDDYNLNLVKLLETINKRIEVLLDHDHLIGHSYFVNIEKVNDLKDSFSRQIIPLLQEYFYGDYGKISSVLGEGFCRGEKVTDVTNLFAFAKDYDMDVFSEKIVYKLADVLKMENNKFIVAIKILLKEEVKTEEEFRDNE